MDRFERAISVFRQRGGMMSTGEAMGAGIHPDTLYRLRDRGELDRLSRGVYRLATLPALDAPDLVAVVKRIPSGVVCLISALSFHNITTRIPHEVQIAVKRGSWYPHIDHPPVRVFHMAGRGFTEGIQTPKVDSVRVRVYAPEKTLADCFKYRNKIGLDTAIEALKLYRQRMKVHVDELLHFARLCEVEKVLRPYLEALL